MAYSDPARQAEYLKEWRARNNQRVNRVAKTNRDKLRERNRLYVWKIKESSPCADCGNFYHPVAMDFDHVGEKIAEISRLCQEASLKRLQEEIDKCELVCSNCHRVRTHGRSKDGAPNQI